MGDSIIAEELKGCPRLAAEVTKAALADARADGNPGGLFVALCDRGLALVLQGLPGAAERCLAEVTANAQGEIALLAAVYARLATTLRFNAFADGQGSAANEILARFDPVAYEVSAARRMDELAAAISDSPVLAVRRLVELVTASSPIRNTLELMRFIPNPSQSVRDALPRALLNLERSSAIVSPPSWIAWGRYAAADSTRRAGDRDGADKLLATALDVYRTAGDEAGEGICELAMGDWDAAPFSSPLNLNLAIRESVSEGSDLDWQLEAAESALDGSDLLAARRAYDRAEAAFTAAVAPRGLAAVALRRGYLASLAGDHDDAAARCAAAAAAFEDAGDLVGTHVAAIHTALARIAGGALDEDRAVAATVGAWGAGDGSFSVALGLGLLCGRAGRDWVLRRGDVERALACERLAAALFEALGARLNRAQTLVDQADTLAGVGDAAAADALYEAAAEHNAAAAQDVTAVAEVAHRRALLLTNEVLMAYHTRQDADGMDRVSARVGELLAARPSSTDPQDAAVAALAEHQVAEMGVAIPLARAMECVERGQRDDARPYFVAAMAATAQVTDETRHRDRAVILASQERYDEAIREYQLHRELRTAGNAMAASEMLGPAHVQRQRRRGLEQDLAFFTRVHAWHDAQAAADALVNLDGADWFADDERPWGILSDLATVQAGLDRLDAALRLYERATEAFEARREMLGRAGLRSALAAARDVQWLYFLAARSALALADAEPQRAAASLALAFGYAERGKARALLDAIARTPRHLRDEALHRRWGERSAEADTAARVLMRQRTRDVHPSEVRELGQRLAQAQEALRQIESELTADDPQWLRSVRAAGGDIASVKQVAAALPDGAALLQWLFLGRDLIGWAITVDGVVAHVREELDARALSRSIRELRSACESGADHWETLAQPVAAALLEPFAGVLAAHERLIVIPYGVAHQLPVHVLPFNGRPLGVTHTISMLPSASVLRYATRGTRPWKVLAIGNPARMSHRPLGATTASPAGALRGAEAEAVAAAATFPGGEALLHEHATEDAVRGHIADFPILHFATHGMLEEDAPGLSALLLADGAALTVQELGALDLDVDLAVLSACRTGQGETTRGDDVVGLARALLAAGCRAAVVSLWPVDDASTTLLMAAFYGELKVGSSPADALSAAQRHLRGLTAGEAKAALETILTDVPARARDMLMGLGSMPAAGYGHPYHWAPFVLLDAASTNQGDR